MIREMRAMDRDELRAMKQVEMTATSGPALTHVRRDKVLSE